MQNQRQIKNLDDLMDGTVTERFNYEMDRVLNNVFDPNTSPRQKRQIQIVIDIVPNEKRDAAEFKIDVKSKLASTVPTSQTVFLAQGSDGSVIATEITNQVMGQVNMEGDVSIPKVVNFGSKRSENEGG